MCGSQHWHSSSRGTDHIGEAQKILQTVISSTPPVFILEIASLQHGM